MEVERKGKRVSSSVGICESRKEEGNERLNRVRKESEIEGRKKRRNRALKGGKERKN